MSDNTGSAWRVLVADNEPTQRLIMARLLKRAGFAVDTASNGREALAKIHSGDFQLMLTDWDMPEMDGIALCSTLRKSANQAYIYIILLTARDSIEHVVTGLQAGADDYLTKPVIEPELIARLSTGKRIVTLERSLRVANEENQRLGYAHPVTGVYNYRYLMMQLPREIELAKHQRQPLCIILCDADYLKSVNDSYGHEAGGRTLRAMAELLDRHAKEANGWLVHHGGDEFSIVLPNTGLSIARKVAERVRISLCEEVTTLADIPTRVTASFGVSGWERVPRGATMKEVMDTADQCVYASKAAGRNRVTDISQLHENSIRSNMDIRSVGSATVESIGIESR